MPPATVTRPTFQPDISFEVQTEHLEERCTIVHCTLRYFTLIRIWPTTYLIQENGTRKKLLHAFQIAPYPDWKFVGPNHCFTLVFEGLDRGCQRFDLLEDIPEEGGFSVPGIRRNGQDVYWVEVD
ncbi:MAG TPA: hypothetical protein VHK69_09015 [Chitinophagaceae bacterium]|jgi:hypothetical protein|nr:hypothetical protein [Chitinophagaceae bacterium]